MIEDKTEIHRWLDKLDTVATQYEADWGIGNLVEYADEALRGKWEAQNRKLSQAVEKHNIEEVKQLVDGMIRGWSVLEQAAIASGYTRKAPEYWEVGLPTGFKLRVCKTNLEARGAIEDGVYVWSLKEIARVLEKDYTLVNKVKEHFPEANVKEIETFDFEKGDDVGI